MRKNLLVAGVAAAVLIPTGALAQQTCEQQRSSQTARTLVGAGIVAVAGAAVAGRDDRTAGAAVGGIAGAIVGNQMSKPRADCANAYGYYDAHGAWHATGVDRTAARGYFDRSGAWVDGAPNGYYDQQGRWIPAPANAAAGGYYDSRGHYVPASAQGYYDADGRMIAGAVSGYYDRSGRWVAGPAVGRYDTRGNWIAGQPAGRQDANGRWVAEAQPGYYDTSGRWVAGPANGYYDARGRWIPTAISSHSLRSEAGYGQRGANWDGTPADVRSRQAWLGDRIRSGLDDGSLTRREANRAFRSLEAIRREEVTLSRRRGGLSDRNEAYLQAKLNTLRDSIRWARQDVRRTY